MLDDVIWYLGVTLEWKEAADRTLFELNISEYPHIERVLYRFGMENCKPITTPISQSFWTSLSSEVEKKAMKQNIYGKSVVTFSTLL